MGLKIHSLEGLPNNYERDYYVYLLDYGWDEPLGQALRNNFDKFSTLASKQKSSVLLMRTEDGVEFNDDVLSWHGINGDSDPSLLPAVLITNRHPSVFRELAYKYNEKYNQDDLKLILIPLKRYCKTTGEVIELIQRIFLQISEGRDLKHFKIGERKKAGKGKAIVDSIILAPTLKDESIKLVDIMRFLKSNGTTDGPEKTVHPIHFEDRSGTEFERLSFAYLLNIHKWDTAHWLGQTGNDGGRDIWGQKSGESYCYQCANYQNITFKKAKEDIDKLIQNSTIPHHWTLICGGKVTTGIRKQILDYANQELTGIKNVDIWSGVEFEERIRRDCPSLIQRFVLGEPFPDSAESLSVFSEIMNTSNDTEIVKLLAESFDRPAFTTAFRNESNIPDFEKAITDTIEVLNTGVHRLRDGTIIRRIPTRHQITDKELKSALTGITQQVINLRNTFSQLKKDEKIKHCNCGASECPVWFIEENASQEMDDIRNKIFRQFKAIYPEFSLHLF